MATEVFLRIGRQKTPIDAFELAAEMKCVVHEDKTLKRGARLLGKDDEDHWVIELNTTARTVRQQGVLSHELGHVAITESDVPDSEEAASLVGAALMLPKYSFETDFKRQNWDLAWMKAKHIHCSWELIVRRACTLFAAVATIWDNGELTGRHRAPTFRQFQDVSPLEKHMAREVLEAGKHLRFGDRCYGYAVFDRETGWKRVVTIVDVMTHAKQMWAKAPHKVFPPADYQAEDESE